MTKYIFVTGGVVSGLGKGIACASIGLILKSRGFTVVNQKFDPYLNIDPGTMNPYQHGEVFVTDDGAETDLDLGHYERFTGATLTQSSNTTAGSVYLSVLNKERAGGFHGGTVQVIPNITEEILARMLAPTKERAVDIVITEIGGTVGDIESLPFIEAIRQMKYKVGVENCCYIHLTLVPYIERSRELKTKPTQHSVKELQAYGIQPDIVMLRTDAPIDISVRERLASLCNVPGECVIPNITTRSIYEVPLNMEKEGLGDAICRALGVKGGQSNIDEWRAMVKSLYTPSGTVTIALVGKYIALHDAYLSVVEALVHGGIASNVQVVIDWVNSEELIDEETTIQRLKGANGIIIPGGFGDRGIEGMIRAAHFARLNNVPYFGICLGMQVLVIEYARSVLGLSSANSTEANRDTSHPVIDIMGDQEGKAIGGTLRRGKYECAVKDGTLLYAAYSKDIIWERHRHRYEFNNAYRTRFIQGGLIISGINRERDLVEAVEVGGHPWCLGVQFHPEFKSRPNDVAPLFRDFIKASLKGNSVPSAVDKGKKDKGVDGLKETILSLAGAYN